MLPATEKAENRNTESDSVAPVVCTHCGLPVPKGLIEPDSTDQFCCGGCKTAYHLIQACGLDAYYSMVEPANASRLAIQSDADVSRFEDFDQPIFLNKFARPIGGDQLEATLALDGIHCAACIWLIEKLPQIVNGVSEVQLNWARQTVRIRWAPGQTTLSQIAATLCKLGYTPHPVRQSERELRRQLENRKHLSRIGIAAAAAGNNMLIAGALYFGMFSYMSLGMTQMFRVASCLVGLAALIWPGRVFLSGAMAALRTRTPHMDLPIALGLTIGSVAGLINTVRGSGEIYFDSLSVLIFLLLVGRWIQFRQQNRAADAVEMLYRMTPKRARKLVNGQTVEVFVDMIEVGDELEILAGDLLPVDGVVVAGESEIDESILSGESRAIRKKLGDEVLAGTQNRTSRIVVETTAIDRDTRLSRIVELVEQSSINKPEVVQWANRIGGYFVTVVLTLAFITLATWIWFIPAVAVERTVALLIVACPCALAIATPLAISVALGRAAKHKIMVKGGDVLQSLVQPGMIWLDKTGTLTKGDMAVVRWYGNTSLNEIVAAIETESTHPVAKAIVQFVGTDRSGLSAGMFPSVEELEGQGIHADCFGNEILIGNARLLVSNDVSISRQHQRIADRIVSAGFSPCWIAVRGTVSSILALADQIRPETESAIQELKLAGWQVGILSGDHQGIVERVASRLGINPELAMGEQSPEQKLEIVRQTLNREQKIATPSRKNGNDQATQTVVMVGDGVNDSAALAAATVGIAVHGGAEASLSAAPVYLAEDGLSPILRLISISQSTGRTMRISFCISLLYNIAGATLAFFGYINPLVAAILMPISSLTVVALSLSAGKVNIESKAVLAPGGELNSLPDNNKRSGVA